MFYQQSIFFSNAFQSFSNCVIMIIVFPSMRSGFSKRRKKKLKMYYVWNLSFHSAHNFNFIFFFLLFIISPLVRSLFFIRNMKFDSDIRLFFTPKKKMKCIQHRNITEKRTNEIVIAVFGTVATQYNAQVHANVFHRCGCHSKKSNSMYIPRLPANDRPEAL